MYNGVYTTLKSIQKDEIRKKVYASNLSVVYEDTTYRSIADDEIVEFKELMYKKDFLDKVAYITLDSLKDNKEEVLSFCEYINLMEYSKESLRQHPFGCYMKIFI